jgi:hypothetical protein
LLLDTDYEPAMTLIDDNGTVIACGGFRCIPGGVAEAWAVAGPLAEKYPLAFCKETRRLMRRWMKEYGIRRLTASVDYADKKACRWAHWLGFDRVLGEYFRYDDEVLLLVVIKE